MITFVLIYLGCTLWTAGLCVWAEWHENDIRLEEILAILFVSLSWPLWLPYILGWYIKEQWDKTDWGNRVVLKRRVS